MSGLAWKGFTCWNGETIGAIHPDVGQADDEALFLAANRPPRIDRLARSLGNERSTPRSGSSAKEVLEEFRQVLSGQTDNTIVAMTGDRGTGKSHVVRWVLSRLNFDERMHVIYIPRSVQTFQGLMQAMLGRLPGDGASQVLERLDGYLSNKSPEFLTDSIAVQIPVMLRHQNFMKPEFVEAHEQYSELFDYVLGELSHDPVGSRPRVDGLGDLLAVREIYEQLKRADGGLAQFAAALLAPAKARAETHSEISSADLPTDMEFSVPVGLRGLWNNIEEERILRVVLYLANEAMRMAASSLLGLRSDAGSSIADLFGEARRELKEQGKELVLIFEDLQQFSLIDSDLFTQFAVPEGDDNCRLHVMFAVTDDVFDRRVPPTTKDRLSRFDVKEFDASELETFLAAYLNLGRLGAEATKSAYADAGEEAKDKGTWVPNHCDIASDGGPCHLRDECFRDFGFVEVGDRRVGLYPYSEAAVTRVRRKLGSSFRARVVVGEYALEFLRRASIAIPAGTFPTRDTMDLLDSAATRTRDSVVPQQQELQPEEADRLYRARLLWANENVEAHSVAEAFSLPLVSEDIPPAQQADSKCQVPGCNNSVREGIRSCPEHSGTPNTSPPSGPMRDFMAWRNGEALAAGLTMRSRRDLYRMVIVRAKKGLDRCLVHTGRGVGAVILNQVLKESSFVIQGAPGSPGGKLRFDIDRSDDGVKLLLAVRWITDAGHWDVNAEDAPWSDLAKPDQAAADHSAMDLQLQLESYLDSCAARVVAAVRSEIGAGRGDSAAVRAVQARVTGLRAMGSACDRDASVASLFDCPPASDNYGAAIASRDYLARAGIDVVKSDLAAIVNTFATARQGDTGLAQVVDAALLEPGRDRVLNHPNSVFGEPVEVSDELSELAVGWSRMSSALASADALLRVQEGFDARLRTLIDAPDPEGSLERAHDVLGQAQSSGALRPAGDFHKANEACSNLSKNLKSLGQRSEPEDRQDPDAVTNCVLDSRSWEALARSMVVHLDKLEAVLQETARFARDEVERRGGASVDEAAGRLIEGVDRLVSVLREVEGSRE